MLKVNGADDLFKHAGYDDTKSPSTGLPTNVAEIFRF